MTIPGRSALERAVIEATDRTAELMTICRILLHPDEAPTTRARLTEGHFFHVGPRAAWRAICRLADQNQPITPVSLKNLLVKGEKRDGDTDRLIREFYDPDNVPTAASAEAAIARLQQCVHLRERARLLHELETRTAENGEFRTALDALLVHEERDPLRTAGEPTFQVLDEDRFVFTVPQFRVSFRLDRLRRERNELIGELAVRCSLAGVRTVDGNLSIADFNLSSSRARQERARLLEGRAKVPEVDWLALLEEFVQRVIAAERKGPPAVDLRELSRPELDNMIDVQGLVLPRRHPSIIFGDGGALKSYLLLYVLGILSLRGLRVALFDWELAGEDHRDRLERLFGKDMPPITYARCERGSSLGEVDFEPHGSTQGAEVRLSVVEAEPNGASVRLGELREPGGSGPVVPENGAKRLLLGALGFRDVRHVQSIKRIDLRDVPELAAGLSLSQRIRGTLRSGARSRDEITASLSDIKPDTLRRTLNRLIESGKVIRFPNAGGSEVLGLPSREDP